MYIYLHLCSHCRPKFEYEPFESIPRLFGRDQVHKWSKFCSGGVLNPTKIRTLFFKYSGHAVLPLQIPHS